MRPRRNYTCIIVWSDFITPKAIHRHIQNTIVWEDSCGQPLSHAVYKPG